MAIDVPADFAAGIVNHAGDAGRAWIAALPATVESLCHEWRLAVDGSPRHGYLGLVVPVRRGDEPAVLKVSWPDESTFHEASALRRWSGAGAVRLYDADPGRGALLLERLNADRTLQDLAIAEAVTVVAGLLRRLAVPAPPDVPLLRDVAQRVAASLPERWEATGRPMPRAILDAAGETARQLGPWSNTLLANFDLHYENVLAGTREAWLAIDPKVVAGDPEYGLAQLLWTRLGDMQREGGLAFHFEALIERAGLDRRRARSWTLVRCVDYWLWARSVGLTTDPVRCEVVINRLGW